MCRAWRESRRAERDARHPVDHKLEVDAVVRQLHEIGLLEPVYEFSREIRCILSPHAEGDHRSAFPNTAWRMSGSSWFRYWWATVKPTRYFRNSESMLASA